MSALLDFLPFERYRTETAFVEQTLYRSRRFTYGEILDGIGRVFASFNRLGLREGDRVIVWGENSARWAITFYACLWKQLVVVPIDASFSAEFVETVRKATEARLVCSDRNTEEWMSLFQSEAAPLKANAANPDTLLEIIYTSGTTGTPKGVMITHGNILANLQPIKEEYQKYKIYAFPVSPLGFIHLIPLSHLFGQIMGLFIPQMLGARVVFSEPAAVNVVRAIKKNRASAVICVPKQLALLHRYVTARYKPVIADRTPGGVRGVALKWWKYRKIHREFGWKFWAFICGGAALPVEEEKFWSALGYVVIQGYGLTETAPSITITHPFKGIVKGAVGKKLPGVEIRIAEDGEILVRGPNVSPGYYRDQKSTAEVFQEGWLHTGDIGSMDAQGNLQLRGRKKEVIVTPDGLNVYPEDVERALNSDSRVVESAVVAREGAGGPFVHAVVVLKDSAGSKHLPDIIEQANRTLEAFQRIHSASVWTGNALPRTTTGKLKRLAIAAGMTVAADLERRSERLAMKLTAGTVAPGTLDEDLSLSSLDKLELMMELEQATGLEIDDAQFSRARTVGDVKSVLDQAAPVVKHYYPKWRWPLWLPIRWLRNLILYAVVFPLMPLRIKLRVSGVQNIKDLRQPLLFVANHQSVIDVPVILRALPVNYRHCLATAMGTGRRSIEMTAAALFFNTYPLPRQSIGLRDAFQHTGDLVDRGYSILVFPEGERTPDGTLQPFRPGIGVIVKQTRLPVIPVVLRGIYEIWPIGARGPHQKGIAVVDFGAPLQFEGKDPEEITRDLEGWFRNRF